MDSKKIVEEATKELEQENYCEEKEYIKYLVQLHDTHIEKATKILSLIKAFENGNLPFVNLKTAFNEYKQIMGE